MSAPTAGAAARLLADPVAFTDEERVHASLGLLRDNAAVVRVDVAPYRPFWAVVKHDDIVAVERDHALWINGSGSVLTTAAIDDAVQARREAGISLLTMNQMDGERHRALRAIGAG